MKPAMDGARVNAGVVRPPHGRHWHCDPCDVWGTGGRTGWEHHYLDAHWNPTDGDTAT